MIERQRIARVLERLADLEAMLGDPAILDVARRHGRSPAQVILRWHTQLGYVPIPKSSNAQRLAENLDVFGFELATEHMDALNGLDDGTRYRPDPATYTGI